MPNTKSLEFFLQYGQTSSMGPHVSWAVLISRGEYECIQQSIDAVLDGLNIKFKEFGGIKFQRSMMRKKVSLEVVHPFTNKLLLTLCNQYVVLVKSFTVCTCAIGLFICMCCTQNKGLRFIHFSLPFVHFHPQCNEDCPNSEMVMLRPMESSRYVCEMP